MAVSPGGSLSTQAGSTTSILGNVESTNATQIALEGATTVRGELRLAGTTERIDLTGGKADNLIIEGGIPSLAIETESIGGNVQILHTAGAGELEFVGIRASTVGGNVEVDNNSLTGSLINGVFVEEVSVAGNLEINNNSALEGALNLFSVGHNAVGKNLICEGNSPAPTGEANTARKKLGQCKSL